MEGRRKQTVFHIKSGRPALNCTPEVRQYDKLFNGRGDFLMPRGKPLKNYTGEFKQKVVEDMRGNHLSQRETARRYEVSKSMVERWERIYLEEGPSGLYIERRGRAIGPGKGRPPKLTQQVEKDLIAENQRLRAEVDYLKNLHALVQERERRERKRK